MPFLRVLRDKRGYETTYLMHWFREGNRQRSRILYVFRTPPGVKVGRDPINPAVIREIEAQHPDIEFDWRALRENQQVIDTSLEQRRGRPAKGAARAEPGDVRRARKDEKERPIVEKPEAVRGKAETGEAESAAPTEQPARPRLVIPSAIEGTTREEKLVFLLNWYLHLRERVPHRTHDPIRREALAALVERLNPEAWVGEEAIVRGLEDAAEALQRLSTLFAKRRKRSRRARVERVGTGASEVPEAGGSDPFSQGPEPDSDDAE